MIEGLGTVVIAVGAVFVLPGKPIWSPPRSYGRTRSAHNRPAPRPRLQTDYPSTTRWLSEREKKFAVARLVTNEDAADRLGHMQAFKASVKDWKTWAFMLVYVLLNGSG